MPFTLTMPKLSPTMEEGTIVKWRKKEGDLVKMGDPLFEVATDKATIEHTALEGGFLRRILIKEGASACVNQPVAVFSVTAEENIEGYQPEGEIPTPAATPVAAQIAQEPATPLPPRPAAQMLTQPAFVPEPPLEHYTFSCPEGDLEGRIAASPLAKKMALEKGIDLTTVKGSGPQGRIVSRDLHLGQPNATVAFGRRTFPALPPGTYEEEPLSPMRKSIGKRLQESKTYIPHFYVSKEIVVDALVQIRKELGEGGVKLSVNDFILRATALALREHPLMNSGFNSVNNTIVRFKTIDIAVAVNVPAGLITPILRHADFKNIGQLSQEMKWLSSRAREGALSPEEYKGGSFTLSNLGMYGVSGFTAIINPPQAAILAVGGIEEKALVKEGKVVPGKMMTLTVSADHRVLDGALVAEFLKTLQKFLENPSLLLVS